MCYAVSRQNNRTMAMANRDDEGRPARLRARERDDLLHEKYQQVLHRSATLEDALAAKDRRIADLEGRLVDMSLELANCKAWQDERAHQLRRVFDGAAGVRQPLAAARFPSPTSRKNCGAPPKSEPRPRLVRSLSRNDVDGMEGGSWSDAISVLTDDQTETSSERLSKKSTPRDSIASAFRRSKSLPPTRRSATSLPIKETPRGAPAPTRRSGLLRRNLRVLGGSFRSLGFSSGPKDEEEEFHAEAELWSRESDVERPTRRCPRAA